MSPKKRFVVILEPPQLEALRRLEKETDVPVSRLIRRAIDRMLETIEGDKSERKRPASRKRS
jgi:hypothetical protein